MKKQNLPKTKLIVMRETLRSIAVLDVRDFQRVHGGSNTDNYPCSQKGTCGPP